jgi:leucyl aminopeptidase
MPLKPSCVASDLSQVAADFLALGVYAGTEIDSDATLSAINEALHGALATIIEREEFKAKKDQAIELETLGLLRPRRFMLLGLGEKAKFQPSDMRTLGARVARAANAAKVESCAIALAEAPSPEFAKPLAEGLVLGAYRFTKYLTGDRKPKTELQRATIALPPRTTIPAATKKAVELGAKVAACVLHARDLINEPPNELTPVALANFAAAVAKEHGLDCKVFDRKELQKRGFKLHLAVGQGSANEPRFVHLTYKPAKASKKRLVVVGKGLTFDSGGLCIKPAAGMNEMKSDMGGAANVVAFMAAVAELKPNFEVHGLIGAAENMPDGDAYRPGDIFGSLDGKTVEIINTDAEGRLVLADALAYGKALNPTVMICNATLTGACVVALGQNCSGFFATNDELAEGFKKAANAAGEQFWHMPLLEDLKDQLKSDCADLKHTGDRWGGAITAALFLREFVGETPFIHCDIAGPALADKPYSFYTKGGTGHGVLTFLAYVEQMLAKD